MDYFNTVAYWEEESHDSDNINGSCLLWIIIPLLGQVSVQIEIIILISDIVRT